MALEDQVSALVQAANNLTDTVSGKMAEIDESVEAAVKAIPELHKGLYVRSSGNDNALGTNADPLKTIREAVDRIPENGSARIYLDYGEVYEIDSNIGYESKDFEFYARGNDALPKPKISLISFVSADGRSEACGFRPQNKSRVKVRGCEIDTGSLAEGATEERPSPSGFVSRQHYNGNTATVAIAMYQVDITLRDHKMASIAGFLEQSLSNTVIDHQGLAVDLSVASTHVLNHSIVTVVDGSKTMEMLYSGVNAERSNVISNFTI